METPNMSHWYDQAGNSRYTIKSSKNVDRPTTLRDAKKFKYLPSVTTVIGLTAKPGLQHWIQDQLLNAAMDFDWFPTARHLNLFDKVNYEKRDPKTEAELEAFRVISKWKAIILEKSQKIGRDAADRGSEIHNALELFYKEGKIDDKHRVFIEPVIDFIAHKFPEVKDWQAEPSFAAEQGFGGKIDLVSVEHEIILDFKTKKDKAFTKSLKTDDYGMQLAAYGEGMGFVNFRTEERMGRYYNLFISVETPDLLRLEEYSLKEIDRNWKMFYNLLKFWQLSNNYDSSFTKEQEEYNGN
jgi:hypothetical protein